MRTKEQKLYDRLYKACTGKDIYLQRIENMVHIGTPDCICIHKGRVTWLELKVTEVLPKRKTSKAFRDTRLSLHQKNFILFWDAHNGNAAVLYGIGKRLFLLLPQVLHYQEPNDMTLEDLEKCEVEMSDVIAFLKGE